MTKNDRSISMKKSIITAAIASFASLASLASGASIALANPAPPAGPDARPVADMPMHSGNHHKMHGMSGGHDMTGKGGMDHEHMQQMHNHMGSGGMMGGGNMGNMAPSATQTPMPTSTPKPVAPN
jgi:hypothetical protein